MARKTNKQKAQELIDEVKQRLDFVPPGRKVWRPETDQEKKAWAQDALPKMDEVVTELDPKNAWAWFLRGVANSELSNHQSAIDDYTTAIELDPKNDHAWNNRGEVKDKLGDYQGAIDDYNKAIELIPLIPGDAFIRIRRGDAKRKLGDHKGASDDITKGYEEIFSEYSPRREESTLETLFGIALSAIFGFVLFLIIYYIF